MRSKQVIYWPDLVTRKKKIEFWQTTSRLGS